MKAVLFDWDGTLVDSRRTVLEAYRRASRDVVGYAYPTTAAEEESVLTGHTQVSLTAIASDPQTLESLVAATVAAYPRATPALAFDGATDLLDSLRAGGVRIGVVTSKVRRSFEHDAEHLGLSGRVDAVVAGDDGHRPKPDPAPVLACLAELGASPTAAVFVGDGPDDVAAGRAAGVRTVAALHGFAPRTVLTASPDRTIDSLGGLRAVLAEELGLA